jgi:hypothetical protein
LHPPGLGVPDWEDEGGAEGAGACLR